MRRYIREILPYLVAEIVFDAFCTALIAFTPVLQKWLFDRGLTGGARELTAILLTYAAFQFLSAICENFCMLFTWKGAIKFELLLKRSFFRSVFQMPNNEFYKRPVGEYISLQGNNITALEQDYLQPFVDIVRSVNMFIIYGVVLFVWIDWRIALVILLTSLLTVVGPKLTGKVMSDRNDRYMKQMAAYVSKITDLLEGFRLINTSTREKINQIHEKVLKKTAVRRYNYGKAKTISLTINDLAIKMIQIASFAAAALLLANREITIGTGVATFGYVSSFLDPIKSILYDVNAIQSVKEIKKDFLDYGDRFPQGEKKSPQELMKNISLAGVNYQCHDFSIKNISFSFEKGKKYAIIGHSGSGKSTLLRLLMGYVSPASGSITVDDSPLQEIDLSQLTSYIDQNEHIFQDGYIDNATVYGTYSVDRLQKLIGQFQAQIFEPLRHKNGLENCQTLSGGEKQALAYLRMLTKDTSVMLMDEPFSAVDSKTREVLENYLFTAKEMEAKTMIVVTHDLTDHLNRFDEVLLMENGSIVKHGKFETMRDAIGSIAVEKA